MQRCTGVTFVIKDILPLSNHTKVAIIDDGDLEWKPLGRYGRELSHRHLKAPISSYNPDFFIRPSSLNADSSWKREAHGAKSARRDQTPMLDVGEILRLPHLVLADVCDDCAVTVIGQMPKLISTYCSLKP